MTKSDKNASIWPAPWVHAHVTRSNSAITNYFDKRSQHKTEKTIQEEQARQRKEE